MWSTVNGPEIQYAESAASTPNPHAEHSYRHVLPVTGLLPERIEAI